MSTPGTIIALGSFRLTAYGLIVALGILAGYLLAQRQGHLARIRDSALQKAFFFMLTGALVCSRALFVAVQYGFYQEYPQALLKAWEGGYSVMGALTGALIGLRVATGRRGFRRALDTMAPALALTLAICRLAELSCYQGRGMIIESGAWGFPFTIRNSQGLDCLAICIYEALGALAVMLYGLGGYRARPSGDRGLMCMMLLGLMQVPLESMRTDEFLALGFVKMDQLAAMLLAVGVLATFLIGHIRAGRGKPQGFVALGISLLMVGLCVNEEFRIDGSPNLALNYTLLFAYVLVIAVCGGYLRLGWRASVSSPAASAAPRASRSAPAYYPRASSGSARTSGEPARSGSYARSSGAPVRSSGSSRPSGSSGSAPGYSPKVDAYRNAQSSRRTGSRAR
ncbi:MAG: prolipoprotein diacylglyceryl transferase family protein [Candidatus Fimadaptatus sp.]